MNCVGLSSDPVRWSCPWHFCEECKEPIRHVGVRRVCQACQTGVKKETKGEMEEKVETNGSVEDGKMEE